MIVGVDAQATAGAGTTTDSIPIGAAAVTGVALGVVICAAESLLFRSVIGVPGPGTIPVINRLIAPNQAYVMVGGWVLAAAAGVLLAAARSGVVGWSTRPGTAGAPSQDGAAVLAAIGLVLVAVPLSILAVSGGPGAIPSWRAGVAGATAAAVGGGLALAGRHRLPVARVVVLAYAASFWAEVVFARVVGRLSTSAWVEGSGDPAARMAHAMSFSSTWAIAAYAAAGAAGAAVAATTSRKANIGALTPPAGVVLGLLVAGLATPATLHLSTHVATRLAASLAGATVTAAALHLRKRT
jgi:hypothetical protein